MKVGPVMLWKQYGFQFDRLDNNAVKAGELNQYDIIILPDMRPENIYTGSANMPPSYQGGLGDEGVAALAKFVQGGGTLLAMGEASAFPVEHGLVAGVELADLSGVNAPGFPSGSNCGSQPTSSLRLRRLRGRLL